MKQFFGAFPVPVMTPTGNVVVCDGDEDVMAPMERRGGDGE